MSLLAVNKHRTTDTYVTRTLRTPLSISRVTIDIESYPLLTLSQLFSIVLDLLLFTGAG